MERGNRARAIHGLARARLYDVGLRTLLRTGASQERATATYCTGLSIVSNDGVVSL